MYSVSLVFALIFFLDTTVFVNAALFVFNPSRTSGCHGGRPCTIEWVEDGSRPLLSTFGLTTVGLYTGKQQLIQAIEPVNVAQAHSLTFTPKPGAGPNSSNYYIGFISTTFTVNGTVPGAAFSTFFTLDGMTGSFNSPLAAATSNFPLPSVTSSSLSSSSSVTVGSLSPTITATVSSMSQSSTSSSSPAISASKLVTSLSSKSSQTSTMSFSAPSTSLTPVSNGSLARIGQHHAPSFILAFLCFVLLYLL